jgi:hypothetical protein
LVQNLEAGPIHLPCCVERGIRRRRRRRRRKKEEKEKEKEKEKEEKEKERDPYQLKFKQALDLSLLRDKGHPL